MDAFGGYSIGVNLVIGNAVFSANSVSEMTINFPMGAMPYGRFVLSVPTSMRISRESGQYGTLMFVNSGHSYLDGRTFSIYIKYIGQRMATADLMYITVDWVMGTPEFMGKQTFAINASTSVDALRDIFKRFGNISVMDMISASGKRPVDSMTWRFVNSDATESANDVVEHSNVPGEYLFWCYDETLSSIKIGGFDQELNTMGDICVFSRNALQATGSATIEDSNGGGRLWLYGNEIKDNVRGNARADMFPEILENAVVGGKADVKGCRGDCFNNVAAQLGAVSPDTAKEMYGIDTSEKTEVPLVYGNLTSVSEFPLNVHKLYPLATTVRNRLLAEYSKMMKITVYNDLGPAVGSCVGVMTFLPDLQANGMAVDVEYADKYIVLGKRSTLNRTTSSGILGSSKPLETPSLETEITLISNPVSSVAEVTEKATTLVKSLTDAGLLPENLVG